MSNNNEVPVILDRNTLLYLRSIMEAAASDISHEDATRWGYYDLLKTVDFLFRFSEACSIYANAHSPCNIREYSRGQYRAELLQYYQQNKKSADSVDVLQQGGDSD